MIEPSEYNSDRTKCDTYTILVLIPTSCHLTKYFVFILELYPQIKMCVTGMCIDNYNHSFVNLLFDAYTCQVLDSLLIPFMFS